MSYPEPAMHPTMLTGAEYQFRDLTPLTRWVEGLLALIIAVHVVGIMSGVAQYDLLELAGKVSYGDFKNWADANDHRQQVIAVMQITALVVTVVVFACWIYRANCNARALGARGMTFTPGWSVGWYFVPIASLWKPFQAMREIWKASVSPANWQSLSTDPLLGWWWFGFIVSTAMGQLAFRFSLSASSLEDLRAATVINLISDVVDSGATVLAILLVERLYRIQRMRGGPS